MFLTVLTMILPLIDVITDHFTVSVYLSAEFPVTKCIGAARVTTKKMKLEAEQLKFCIKSLVAPESKIKKIKKFHAYAKRLTLSLIT